MEHIRCNLCGADDYKVKYKGALKEELGAAKGAREAGKLYSASSYHIGNDQVVECNKCGLVYVNPRLRADVIIKGYSDAEDMAYVSQAEGRLRTFRKSVKLIEKYAPGKGRLLDVGCAAGFFLKAAKDSGWDVRGVEPSRWLAEWGRKKYGLDIRAGTLDSVKFPSNSFDAVTMWDVLEHVPDPFARDSLPVHRGSLCLSPRNRVRDMVQKNHFGSGYRSFRPQPRLVFLRKGAGLSSSYWP